TGRRIPLAPGHNPGAACRASPVNGTVGPRTPSMFIDSVKTLLRALRRLQLLTAAQVDEVARKLGPHFTDPRALADHLAKIDWLTAYQCELLFAGRWDELVVGRYQILDRLGAGSVSEVFKAWDTLLGRVVAL